jgi:beta-glucosidase
VRRSHRRPAIIAGLVLAVAARAGATAPDRRCQAAVAAAGRKLFSRSLAILASCARRSAHDHRSDCLNDPATRRMRDAAAVGTRRFIEHACTDAQIAALGPAGACTGVLTVADLSACLRASHEAEAADLLALATPRAAVGVAVRGCAATVSLEARRSAVIRLRHVQHCKSQPDQWGIVPGMACGEAPALASSLARRDERAVAKIASACEGEARAGPFGGPCDVPATTDDLARCVLAASATAADGAVAAEYPDPSFCGDGGRSVERRIDDLLAQMTPDEKIAQMHGSGLEDSMWRQPANERLGIPGLGMLDGPRGVSLIAGRGTSFPVAMARAAAWDTGLEERVGEAIADEVRAKGASVLLAPTINLLRHPRWGRAQETYGEDALHVGRMGVAFIRGAQRHTIASAKHFAVNSIEDTRLVVDVSVDERTLREMYLPHFRMAVQQGHVGSVMAAYNMVNGRFNAENFHLLRDILKGQWRFQGFVESDWFVATHSTAMSVMAGLDIEMPVAVYYGEPLESAVEEGGAVQPWAIDDAVRRVLRAKFCFRLDTDPPTPDPTRIETPAHLDLALDAAREGMVLLRNRGGALPLDRSRITSLVVVGSLASIANLGDQGSSVVAPSFAMTPLDGIRALGGAIDARYVPGPPLSAEDQDAVATADAAVVIAGLAPEDEGEGGGGPTGDRITLDLGTDQEELITAVAALNPRTIVVLEAGSAVTMPWVDDVSAILLAWYPGQMGGQAIAEVLFGDVNPAGRLPLTFPRVEADLPKFDNLHAAVRYGYFHGYRWLDRRRVAPLYPFGFGLSYTTLRYSNLMLSRPAIGRYGRLRVTVDVTNTGDVAGDEVVQLYVGTGPSQVVRPVRDLRDFARVHLEPGQTRTVPLEVLATDLAYWDVTANAWRVEPTRYRVEVGSSSHTLPLTASFSVSAR